MLPALKVQIEQPLSGISSGEFVTKNKKKKHPMCSLAIVDLDVFVEAVHVAFKWIWKIKARSNSLVKQIDKKRSCLCCIF